MFASDQKAERARLYRVSLLLLGFCLVPIGLSLVPGVSVATLVAPFVALGLLVGVAAVARYKNALSGPLAFAIASWGAAAVLAAAGVAAVEFGTAIAEPPVAMWLNKKVCRDNHSAWVLLCPFALMFDLLMVLFLVFAYAAWAFGWGVRHLGAPVLLGAAAVSLLLGFGALRGAGKRRATGSR
jgi:hypothetical protein